MASSIGIIFLSLFGVLLTLVRGRFLLGESLQHNNFSLIRSPMRSDSVRKAG
jgi:hypothetical protein